MDPVYQWLTKKELNGLGDYKISWNFNKFLVDENGKLTGAINLQDFYQAGII